MSAHPHHTRTRPQGWVGWVLHSVFTTVWLSIAAWCVLSMCWGYRLFYRYPSVSLGLEALQDQVCAEQAALPMRSRHWFHQIPLRSQSLSTDTLHTVTQTVTGFKTSASTATHNPFAWMNHPQLTQRVQQIGQLLIETIQWVILRLLWWMNSWPLLCLSLGVGAIDGWVSRQRRRYHGARESTFLFHRIKQCGPWLGWVPLSFSLMIPISYPICWVSVPVALLCGLWIQTSVRFFKKYA